MSKRARELADDHKRCAIAMHNRTHNRRFDSPTDKLVVMNEAVYHATMAVLHELRAQAPDLTQERATDTT